MHDRSRIAPLRGLSVIALVCLTVSCAQSEVRTPDAMVTSTTVESFPTVGCVEPPPGERATESPVATSVTPATPTPGEAVVLEIAAPTGHPDASVGAAAEWQCWSGDGWVPTHQLVRDWGQGGPQTVYAPPGATTTVPSIGLPLPARHTVLVPDVPPGTYRIADRIHPGDGGEIIVFTLVEVRSP